MEETINVHILDESGTIVNTIVVLDIDDFPGAIEASIGGTIGDRIVDGVVIPREPEEAVLPVPERVTRRQARQALLIEGHLANVDSVIAEIEDPIQRGLAQIEWEDATEFDRHRDLVIQIGAALGLDEEGLDDIFRLAATL